MAGKLTESLWMVDHTDLLIAVWDGGPGGTANTIRYARSNGFPSGSSIWIIDVRDGERDGSGRR